MKPSRTSRFQDQCDHGKYPLQIHVQIKPLGFEAH